MSTPAIDIPTTWTHQGLVIARQKQNRGVVGDPCIVWDDAIANWRMILFADAPEMRGCGQSVCLHSTNGLPDKWSPVEPIVFEGPHLANHKPYIVQEAHNPNRAAKINGEYWLLSIMCLPEGKSIRIARSAHLAGPWTWDAESVIATGEPGAFGAEHAIDAVSGFYFPERNEVLYYFMGYPKKKQPRAISPWGNAQGVAVQKIGEPKAKGLGVVMHPEQQPGHWGSGWIGTMQIMPGKTHRWVALLNASPTAPNPEDKTIARLEPAPSLGGWAYCDEEWPVKNWHLAPQPMEWIENLPPEAVANGEGTNQWRQHALILPDGRVAVYYNSGYYNEEQLYLMLSAGR